MVPTTQNQIPDSKKNTTDLKGLVVQLAALSELLTESQGEVTPETEALLVQLDQELKHRIDVYRELLKRLELETLYCRTEASEWAAKARSKEAAIERLKERIKEGMNDLKIKRIEGYRHGFSLSALKPKVVIDENLFPTVTARPDLYYQVVENRPNKAGLFDRLSQGEVIEGASLKPVWALRPIDLFPTIDMEKKESLP